MELFGHQAVFQDPPIRFSASNAYKRVVSRRFRLSHRNDKAGKYALAACWSGPIRIPARSSQFKARLIMPALSSSTPRDTCNRGSGVRLKQTR
jgi:hypothetical protein